MSCQAGKVHSSPGDSECFLAIICCAWLGCRSVKQCVKLARHLNKVIFRECSHLVASHNHLAHFLSCSLLHSFFQSSALLWQFFEGTGEFNAIIEVDQTNAFPTLCFIGGTHHVENEGRKVFVCILVSNRKDV